jgi:hypothetical protein
MSFAAIAIGVGVAGVGLGAATAAGAFDPAKPDYRSLPKEVQDYLNQQGPILASHQTYDPQYAQLYNTLAQQSVFGGNGTPGMLALYEQNLPGVTASTNAAANSTFQNALQQYASGGPQVRAAFKATNPELAGLLDQMVSTTSTNLSYGAALDPVLQRNISQQVRAAQATRGMGYGQGDAAEEALASVVGGQNLYQTRLSQAAGAAQLYAGIYPQLNAPTFTGNAGASPNLLASFLGGAGSSAGYAAGQFGSPFNNYSSNLYDTNLGAQINYNNTIANLRAQGASQIAGGATNMVGGMGNAGMFGGGGGGGGGYVGANPGGGGYWSGWCWVAREVFGEADPRWQQFRGWLLAEAPAKLRGVYLRCGERFAKKLRTRPKLKAAVKVWMSSVLSTLNSPTLN